MRLRWLGHAAFHIDTQDASLLLDPWITGNPKAPEGALDEVGRVHAILLTHGHDDHLGDTIELAKRHDATVVAMFELGEWLAEQGVAKLELMGFGGSLDIGGGVRVAMVPAWHSSSVTRQGAPIYLGNPAGLVIQAEGKSIYATGDTGLFSDMALIQRIYRPTVGLIPVGDRFTMGPELAAIACNEFLDLETIVPIHWGTFDVLHGDPQEFKRLVKRGEVKILEPGESIEV
jgi:L-ascorbate metabolism protein UlaG (beta-lactamase superfamily)